MPDTKEGLEALATDAVISRAAWAWRNDKDRETDSSDDAYFRMNWRSLPGLRAYVSRALQQGGGDA